MSTQAEPSPAVAEKEERKFTKAQARHFTQLQADVNKAQDALQKFLVYLSEEHGIEPDGTWGVSTTGFVRDVKAQTPPDGPTGQGETNEPIQE